MSIIDPKQALTGSVRDFQELHGTDLMARVGHFYEWQDLRKWIVAVLEIDSKGASVRLHGC